jgi:membrane associated rhomboid family serine protease
MFPLRDENPTEIFPFFTLGIIAVTVFAWVYLQGAGMSEGPLVRSICAFGAIPGEITGSVPYGTEIALTDNLGCRTDVFTWPTLITSMFLHGSWMHLIGNMWFLWIFGNNIEDSMGHLRFLVFYLLTGVIAGLAHVLSDPGSVIPTVGASGAISGIMGAYLVLYPRTKIRTLFIIVILFFFADVPAWVYLVYWYTIQLLSEALQGAAAGVAFVAHMGGFVAGVVLVKLFENRTLVNAKRAHVKLDPSQIPRRGWW